MRDLESLAVRFPDMYHSDNRNKYSGDAYTRVFKCISSVKSGPGTLYMDNSSEEYCSMSFNSYGHASQGPLEDLGNITNNFFSIYWIFDGFFLPKVRTN